MSKFKFGDKVWHEGELIIVWQSVGNKTECLTQNGVLEVYDTNCLTPASDWVICSECHVKFWRQLV